MKYLTFIIFIFLISFISANNITVDYPKEVEVNEEFSVNLELLDFPDGVYDVKIDILCGEERTAKIFNEEWKSTYYYINDVIENSEEKQFQMKIEKECEDANITIKIKNSNDKAETFSNYTIKSVISEEVETSEAEETENNESETSEESVDEETFEITENNSNPPLLQQKK